MNTSRPSNLDEQAILNAFRGPRNRLRTAGGVARASGLSLEIVQQFIQQRPDLFERFPISPGGIPVYGLREETLARAS